MTSKSKTTFGALAFGSVIAVAATMPSGAAALPGPASVSQLQTAATSGTDVHQVQYRGGPYRGYGAPRAYGGPRGYAPAPRGYYAPGPRHYGAAPRSWGYRPWYHRPYYGTIVGGLALGTIIGVTAYGLAPHAPRPDMCWYWADEVQSRGYWDYC